WKLQALAAQKRDNELRRSEELKKVASYFELNTNKSKHHECWTTEEYYEKARKEAQLLSERKIKELQLEERRKKLELMLFQENMQYQQELKTLSYLNKVPTSVLQDINHGIIEKEEQLRRQEAELKLYHAWRLRQPELRAASSHIANGKLKSAWMEQIVEKEMQRKKEEEETRKILQERDETIRKEIELEEERLHKKDLHMKELRSDLQGQIAELSEKETAVKKLRNFEDKERMILEELIFLSKEREREHNKLVAERDSCIVNMGLHKYKLKKKDYESDKEKHGNYKRILDAALVELEQYREREQGRQKNIEHMYDGEARQLNEKQDQLWAKEREARSILMNEVILTLRKQVEEKLEQNIQQQRENVLEREKIVEQMESFHKEVKAKEQETKSQLNSLKLQKEQLDAAATREAELRAAVAHEQEK
ncbi:unnamed protein product, partial [Leptidea sinapis]